ncbi:MAG TPA: type II CAAX endopeptidase family protein [Candidatus Saccharimonadales bacterium]|nr:type II CAAX endopeptidase family protein [Candidatus Saccharimonadales bacterium]
MISFNPITSYVVLTFLLSWGFWAPMVFLHVHFSNPLWSLLYVAGLSGPLFAAAAVTLGSEGWPGLFQLARRTFQWKASPLCYAVALGLLPLLMGVAWFLSAEMGETHPSWVMPSLSLLPFTFVIMTLRGGPLNEELGWRGFLLPRLLRKYNPFMASLILGVIWGAWHLPLWLLSGIPHPYWPYHLFLMLVISCTFLFTWLYRKSKGSVLLAILFHASINTGIHYLPILPPRHPTLVPFEWWVALTWLVAGVIIIKERQIWFSRNPALVPALERAGDESLEPSEPSGDDGFVGPVAPQIRPRDDFGTA